MSGRSRSPAWARTGAWPRRNACRDARLHFPPDPARLQRFEAQGEGSAAGDGPEGGEDLLTSASGDQPAAGAGGIGTGQGIPFDSMMAAHRGAARRYRMATVLLLVIGLVLVGLGLLGILPLVAAIVVGIVTAAVAVFPYREGVERQERIDGLQVLNDEWRELESGGALPEPEREQFLGLLWKLYDKR